MKTAIHQRRRIGVSEHQLMHAERARQRCRSLLRDARVLVYAKITDREFNGIIREEFRGLWLEIEKEMEGK